MFHYRINHDLGQIASKSGFRFRDIENRKLDWKALACVDVNKVIDSQDYDFLQKIIPKIVEAPMQSILNTAALDPAVSTLFRLSQLGLQYLSFCQQFMDHTLYDLRTAYNQLQKKNSSLKHSYKQIDEQHAKALERIKRLESLLGEDKLPEDLRKSASGTSIPCKFCTKNFLTSDLLNAHMERKHGDRGNPHARTDSHEKEPEPDLRLHQKKHGTPQENAEKPGSTEKEEKERTSTEKQMHQDKEVSKANELTRKQDDAFRDHKDEKLDEKSRENANIKSQQEKASLNHRQSSSAESSVSSTPRPVVNEPMESGSVNYILVDRDQQTKLQMELKELKEKMNAAEKEFYQLTLMNNNNNESSLGSHGCEVCAGKSRVDLANAAVQCGGEEKDIDTVSTQAVQADLGEAIQDRNNAVQHGDDAKDNAILASETPSSKQTQPKDAENDKVITELKQEIANLKSELSNQSTAKNPEARTESPLPTNNTDLEQTNSKIDVIQQRFAKFETMYMQSQQEFIASFQNLDERQKVYINDIELTVKDIIERSFSSISRSSLALDAVSEPNLPVIKEAEPFEEQLHAESPKQGDGVGSGSSEYSLTDYSVNENDDEIVYPIAETGAEAEKSDGLVPLKRRMRINRSVAVEELQRRLAEFGVNPSALGVSTRKMAEIAKELGEDREVVKQMYKPFPVIRQKLEKEVDRLAKSKLNPTESCSSISSFEDTQSKKQATTTRTRPKSAKHRTVHDSILKRLISNDIDETDLKDKMVMAQSALDAHRECIQELLKTTAHAPTPTSLARNRLHSIGGQKTQAEASRDEVANDRSNEDELGSSNRYNKMPNVTTRRVVFVNLDEDS